MTADTIASIVILAGGTGGHVYPALAVARELQGRGYGIHWLGTAHGLEARVVPYRLHSLQVAGLRGKSWRARLQGLGAVFGALLAALVIIYRLRPVCALGMGGYVAGPAGVAAWLLRVPLVIHEQNAVAGTSNRLLRRLATRVLTAYPNAFAARVKVTRVGNPVRAELLARGRATGYDYAGQRPLQLFVVGGSQGALAINAVLPPTLRCLPARCDIAVRHQTGPAQRDRVVADYATGADCRAEVFPFIDDMAAMYAWADLVLCRAGALTVAELTVMGRPAILVPLPQAIDNHQLRNAEWLVQQGAALLVPQAGLAPPTLAHTLAGLAAQPQRLARMARAAAAAARPGATGAVATVCEEVRRER